VEKCVACHFYDRNEAQVEDKGVRWGKCRRSVPLVHPVNGKAYMVEGVWPHVRDDDWCGEWTAIKRKTDAPLLDARNLMTQVPASPIRTAGMPAGSLMTPIAPVTSITPIGSAAPVADAPLPVAERFGSD
jgi:hypothetical protein